MSNKITRQQVIEKFQNFFKPKAIEKIKKLADSNDFEYSKWLAHKDTQQGFSLSKENFGLHIFVPIIGKDANIGFHQNNGEPKWSTTKGAERLRKCQFVNGKLHIKVDKAGSSLFLWKDVGSLKSVSQLLERAVELHSQTLSVSDLQDACVGEALRMVKTRIGQSYCRSLALNTWDNCCAITGCKISECLEAAHIVPWKADESRKIKENLILLRSDIHKLFDSNLLKIDPQTLDVTIDDKCKQHYKNLNIRVSIPSKNFSKENFKSFLIQSEAFKRA